MMVGHPVQYAFGTIELLEQNQACQFMRQGHGRKGEQLPGPSPYLLTESKGPTNEKAGTAKIVVVNPFEKIGQILRRHLLSSLIKDNGQVLRSKRLEQLSAFFEIACLRCFLGSIANFVQMDFAPVAEPLKVEVTACLQKTLFEFAHKDQMQGFACHARLL